jgi:hypothetical protein
VNDTHGAGRQPLLHCVHLLSVHGDVMLGDDVPQVGDRQLPKRALGVLDRQLMIPQALEHDMNMLEMRAP